MRQEADLTVWAGVLPKESPWVVLVKLTPGQAEVQNQGGEKGEISLHGALPALSLGSRTQSSSGGEQTTLSQARREVRRRLVRGSDRKHLIHPKRRCVLIP